jgi:hypothetical protein
VLPLAERRELKFPNGFSLRTPLLVPSFSSRVPEIDKVFSTCQQFLNCPFLISAFDVGKGYLTPPFDFAEALFLDSGGYEVGPCRDLSDVDSEPTGTPQDWSEEQHSSVLNSWSPGVPTVVISHDHPLIRIPIEEQILRCKKLPLSSESARELLLKPETRDQKFIKIKPVLDHAEQMFPFQAIGVTEKEIGNSVLDRMLNIARLRQGLKRANLNIPIHVFGSLDTITTLFYFVAGADIFDGLTWLRYAFDEGRTVYRQDFGIRQIGIGTKTPSVEATCWWRNYDYMGEMQREMRRFLNDHDFKEFKYHGDDLKAAYVSVEEEVKSA